MVSVNRNSGQAQGFYLDPSGTPLPGLTPAAPCRRIRVRRSGNPTPSPSLERAGTDQEHDKFLEALQLCSYKWKKGGGYGTLNKHMTTKHLDKMGMTHGQTQLAGFERDWKKIEAFVGSKTVIQIRSHAQKYFLKVQKSGSSERVPPPRTKRKATHPYPQKAAKIALTTSQFIGTYQTSPTVCEPGYMYCSESSSAVTNQPTNALMSTWNYSAVPPAGLITEADAMFAIRATMPTGCCSISSESPPNAWHAT